LAFYKSKLRSTTARRRSLPNDVFLSLSVPVPPLAEQERIVKLLDEANELRRLRTQADSRTAAFIPALFHTMFAGSNRFPTKRLLDLCEFITKGTTPKASEIKSVRKADEVPFLKVYHIADDGSIDFIHDPSFVQKSLHHGLLRR
jgi:type I restriction enzyme S subunit